MSFEIVFAPEAVSDLNDLKANVRSLVRDSIERHLRDQPRKVSKSRIKKLRGLLQPQYRLRVGDDIRVFYDVAEDTVQILAILFKSDT